MIESGRERLPWSETRVLALVSVALALGAPLRTLYHLIDVVGSPTMFLLVSAVALLAGALLARVIRPVVAITVGTVLFSIGIVWYVANLPTDPQFGTLLGHTLRLLTGQRLLQIANVSLWVIVIAPAPVFLTTYFALRRWYVMAVLAAGTTLGFFVLTTDAGVVTTLLGVVGAIGAIGFGRLDTVAVDVADQPSSSARRSPTGDDDGIDTSRRSILEQLAAVIVLPTALSTVVSTEGVTLPLTSSASTIESSLVDASESLTVQGDISLSPTVRFVVESDQPRYWRVSSYDRYTGDGWVRTGTNRPADDAGLDGPPGESRRLEQTVEVQSTIGTVPAAWKPVAYDGDIDIELTAHDGLVATEQLSAGDQYQVTSEVTTVSPVRLRDADDSYPDWVTDQYLQLPESTPDRVGETTATLTDNAEDDYEIATIVEQWLQNNREYSLDVDRPRRNVADRFLHAMSHGYCVYFATTMVVMLRTQGIPSRLAVGYTSGERIDANRWRVRGLHSHAWVEVYVPDNGWIQFDPTPAGPREAAEESRLGEEQTETGREGGEPAATEPTATETDKPTPRLPTDRRESPRTDKPTPNPTDSDTPGRIPTTTGETPTGGTDTGSGLPEIPSREETALGVVALAGTVAGLRRAGVTERLSRAVWLRYQRRTDPETDVEQAFQRVLYVLEQKYRQRDDGETVRAYLDTVGPDESVRRLATLRERVRYGGHISQEMADEAVEIADRVIAER